MNIELKAALCSYKEYTLLLLDAIEKESFDDLAEHLLSRERLIENINKLSYSKEEFTAVCVEYKIMELQQKLTRLVKEKLSITKMEINKFHESKNASISYNKKFSPDSIFFNKKI